MRPRRQVILDAQFGRDIAWLRQEFLPKFHGTRGNVIVPVNVRSPDGHAVTLLIQASDLYMVGWSNEFGEYHLTEHPDHPSEGSVGFSGHYQKLGVFGSNTALRRHAIWSAVSDLSRAETPSAASKLRVQVGLMAITIPEALRQDIVAGLLGSLFANLRFGTGIPRDLMEHYVKNYSKQWRAGDPYVLIPLNLETD